MSGLMMFSICFLASFWFSSSILKALANATMPATSTVPLPNQLTEPPCPPPSDSQTYRIAATTDPFATIPYKSAKHPAPERIAKAATC